MTIFSKNFGEGMASLATPGYAYGRVHMCIFVWSNAHELLGCSQVWKNCYAKRLFEPTNQI